MLLYEVIFGNIIYIIYHILTTFTDQKAGSSLKPDAQHAIHHFPTVLYVINYYQITDINFYNFLQFLQFILNYKPNFITNVRDARLIPASNPAAVTSSHTWVSCPSGGRQNCQRSCRNCQIPR